MDQSAVHEAILGLSLHAAPLILAIFLSEMVRTEELASVLRREPIPSTKLEPSSFILNQRWIAADLDGNIPLLDAEELESGVGALLGLGVAVHLDGQILTSRVPVHLALAHTDTK